MQHNIVTNGNFANGTVGWTASNLASFTAVNNIASFVANAQNGRIRQSLYMQNGSKYYIFAKIKVKASLNQVSLDIAGVGIKYHTGSGNYELLNSLFTWGAASGNWDIRITDFRASVWSQIDVKEIMVANLTAIFGPSNEPTKEWCDDNIKYGVVNGVQNTFNKLANADFESGTGSWALRGTLGTIATSPVYHGVQSLKYLTANGDLYQNISIPNGNKIYCSARAFIVSVSDGTSRPYIGVYDYNSDVNPAYSYANVSMMSVWQTLSLVRTSANGGIKFAVGDWWGGAAVEVYLDSCIVIDLTVLFGAGNEPSKEWCDANIRLNHINMPTLAESLPEWPGTKQFVASRDAINWKGYEGTVNKLGAEGGKTDDWSKWSHYLEAPNSYWYWGLQKYDPIMGMVYSGRAKAISYLYNYYPHSFIAGKSYAFSIWLKASQKTSLQFYSYLAGIITDGVLKTISNTNAISGMDTEWKKFTWTMVCTDTTELGGFGLSFVGNWDGIIIEAAMPQLEEKAAATDFVELARPNGGNHAYSFVDCNRQNRCIAYMLHELKKSGYNPVGTTPTKINYKTTDYPTISDINKIKQNINALKNAFVPVAAPALVVDNTRLQVVDYTHINAIEQNLQSLYEMLSIRHSYKYTGTFYAGQDITL